MKITTKYKLDDKAWLMYKNKIVFAKITYLNINIFKGSQNINYRVEDDAIVEGDQQYSYHYVSVDESKLFKTKQDLISSL